jgi:hypothetical protein
MKTVSFLPEHFKYAECHAYESIIGGFHRTIFENCSNTQDIQSAHEEIITHFKVAFPLIDWDREFRAACQLGEFHQTCLERYGQEKYLRVYYGGEANKLLIKEGLEGGMAHEFEYTTLIACSKIDSKLKKYLDGAYTICVGDGKLRMDWMAYPEKPLWGKQAILEALDKFKKP